MAAAPIAEVVRRHLFYDPRFPVVGKATCKTSLTSTLITGSTAAGEAFQPHIQYVTKAKTLEMMQLNVDVAEHVPWVRGKFVIGHGILAGTYLSEYRDSLK